MRTSYRKDWNRHSNIDLAANASVIAAGLLIILLAATTADDTPAPTATQFAQQGRTSRTAVATQAPRPATTNVRVAGYGDSVRIAEASPATPSQSNSSDLNGDDHAK